MEFNFTTPAILFPTISLLLLAYTNRFLAVATLIRNLHASYTTNPDPIICREISNLRYRVHLIRDMQALGVLSLLFCVICTFLLFAGQIFLAKFIFGLSLILMIFSLALSVREIQVSIDALNLHLRDLEKFQ